MPPLLVKSADAWICGHGLFFGHWVPACCASNGFEVASGGRIGVVLGGVSLEAVSVKPLPASLTVRSANVATPAAALVAEVPPRVAGVGFVNWLEGVVSVRLT